MVISCKSVLTGKERKGKKKPSQRGKVDQENKRLNGRQTDEIWFNLQPILVKCSVCASTHLQSVCDRRAFIGPSRNKQANLYFNDSSHDCNTHDLDSCDIHHQQISGHHQHALQSIKLQISCLTHHIALSHKVETISKPSCVFLSLYLSNHITLSTPFMQAWVLPLFSFVHALFLHCNPFLHEVFSRQSFCHLWHLARSGTALISVM